MAKSCFAPSHGSTESRGGGNSKGGPKKDIFRGHPVHPSPHLWRLLLGRRRRLTARMEAEAEAEAKAEGGADVSNKAGKKGKKRQRGRQRGVRERERLRADPLLGEKLLLSAAWHNL